MNDGLWHHLLSFPETLAARFSSKSVWFPLRLLILLPIQPSIQSRIFNSGLWSLYSRKGPSWNVPFPKALPAKVCSDKHKCWAGRTLSVIAWVQPFISQLRNWSLESQTHGLLTARARVTRATVHLITRLCLKLRSYCFISSFTNTVRACSERIPCALPTISPFQFMRLISQPHWDARA